VDLTLVLSRALFPDLLPILTDHQRIRQAQDQPSLGSPAG
jgi:hypothetical protein